MFARLSVLALCAALIATPALAKDKTAFACDGVFGPDSSEALLIETYGADNVLTEMTDGPEGSTILVTKVFPDDPARMLQFSWMDEEDHAGLGAVDLPPTMAGADGVRVGMSVAEVEAINGAPFNIGGFWWDYGGYAMVETGKFANLDDGCYISLRFAPADRDYGNLDVSAVSGEVTIPSDEPLLETLDVRLQVLTISYPGPEFDDDL